jgi:AcrR family transcriptional regulator
MARRTKDEAERTRNAILDAAEQVFYAQGVARTSLEEIAKAAGVTRGAVYWHFHDKLALLDAMLQRVMLPHEDILDRLAAGSSRTPLDDLQKACLDTLHLIMTDRRRQRVTSILTHRCEYVEEMAAIMKRKSECKERMLKRSQSLFERAKKLKQLTAHWTPSLAAMTLQALMNGLIVGGVEGGKASPVAKSGAACIKAFFASLRKK